MHEITLIHPRLPRRMAEEISGLMRVLETALAVGWLVMFGQIGIGA